MNLIENFNQNFNIDVNDGLNPYIYLIENHSNDLINLNELYDNLENIRLNQSKICNIIVNKKVLLNGSFYDRNDALLNLDCTYWEIFLEDSKIRDLMPYSEYSKLLSDFKLRNKNNHIPFNEETVTTFIEKLSNSKPLLFANKVNTLLGELDRNYKNNGGSKFPPLIIMKSASFEKFPSWESCQKIDDLRFSICQIYNLDLDIIKTHAICASSYPNEWISLENDLLRIKRFNNGNIHILLSDVVYDKLNEVIAILNKNIIPQECKTLRKKTYKYEEK